MISTFLKSLLLSLILISCSSTKKTVSAKIQINTLDSLKAHIAFLADDKLEGRRTGTNGELMAMNYIADQFKNIGLAT